MAEAAVVLGALTSLVVAERLVVRRGWMWDRYEEWPAVTTAEVLLGPGGREIEE